MLPRRYYQALWTTRRGLGARGMATLQQQASKAAPQFQFPGTTSFDNEATQIRTPIIKPLFWTGVSALPSEAFTVDASEYNLRDILSKPDAQVPAKLAEIMQRTFSDVGLVLLTNTGLAEDTRAMKLASSPIIANVMDEYKGGANSRAKIDSNVFDTGAPKEADLHYHHEMAYVGKSTRMLGFCCTHATESGVGATFVSDAIGTTDAILKTELGRKLRDKGITYIRCLTDRETGHDDSPSNDESGVYNHWQTSFGVTDSAEAEALATSRGLEVEWGADRFLKTKFTTSAFEYFAHLDRNVLYSSVADDSLWFDSWPGVRKLPTMPSFEEATPLHRPLKITYGDGSDFTRAELQEYVDLHDQFGVPLFWSPGDVAIVCNFRFAHGRPSYELASGERRELGVILGEMFERVGQDDSKW